jgi:hypothetical protein
MVLAMPFRQLGEAEPMHEISIVGEFSERKPACRSETPTVVPSAYAHEA